MCQGPLCPNLNKKFQKEVSQIANRNLPRPILLGGLSINLNHLKMPPKRKEEAAEDKKEAPPTKDQDAEETPKHSELENATREQSTQTEASKCNICEKYSDEIQKIQEYEEDMAIIGYDPSIHPTTHPYTYPKVGVCPQIINLQAKLNYLN